MKKTALLCAFAAAIAGLVTFVATTAKADGIPASPASPALTYSGVLLRNGIPITDTVEVEVGLWTDQVRGDPDDLICGTGEGIFVTPDEFGTFSVQLPDAPGEGQSDLGLDCIQGLTRALATRQEVFVQLEVARNFISYTVDTDPVAPGTQAGSVDRLPVSGVPFAIESEHTNNAGGALRAELDDIQARLNTLETGGQ